MYATSISKQRGHAIGLMPFDTIISAINGDCSAMDQALEQYDNQMNYLSTCHIRSEEGFLIPIINMEIKDRLQSKLVYAVTRFSVERFEAFAQHKRTRNTLNQM